MGCGSSVEGYNYVAPDKEIVYTDIDNSDPVMTSTITPWPPFDNLKWFDIAFEFKSGVSKVIERFNLQEITKVPSAANFEKEFIKPFSARLEKRIVKDTVRSKAFRASAPELFAHLQKLHEQKKLKLYRTKTTPPDPNATAASVNVIFYDGDRLVMFRDNMTPYWAPPVLPVAAPEPQPAPAAAAKPKAEVPVSPTSAVKGAKAPAAKTPTAADAKKSATSPSAAKKK